MLPAELYQNPRPKGERTGRPLTRTDEQPAHPDTAKPLRVSVHGDHVYVRRALMSV